MDKQAAMLRKLRAVTALALVALYIAGLILMLAGQVQLASILWVVSTLGGIGLLYWMRTVTRRKEEAAKAEAEAKAKAEEN